MNSSTTFPLYNKTTSVSFSSVNKISPTRTEVSLPKAKLESNLEGIDPKKDKSERSK